jgi:hypothetical protein
MEVKENGILRCATGFWLSGWEHLLVKQHMGRLSFEVKQ